MTQKTLDLFNLEGKIAAITGGGGELCGAMAIALGSMGVKVAILDKHLANAKKREETITTSGGAAIAMACDVLNSAQLQECSAKILETWGPVDFLVNGAGGNDPCGTTSQEFFDAQTIDDQDVTTIFDLDPDGYRHVFDVNFLGAFLTTQVFSKRMIQKDAGVIVNISSISATVPLTKVGAYSAAKAAVSNFTRWLAVYFSRVGIRVNAIAPGFFMTEQLRFLHMDSETGQMSPRARKVIERTPMARYGEPADLIGTLIWLLSDTSKFVTGIVVPVDGGFSAFSI